MSLVRQVLPALTIRASDLSDPEKHAKLLRDMWQTLGTAMQAQMALIDKDSRMSDDRIASALRGKGNNLTFLSTGREAKGQIATMLDPYTWFFSDGTAFGGVTPVIVAAGGWTDDGTTVRLTTATDKVAIGTATAIGRFLVLNAGATTDVVATLKGIASQSANMLNILNSSGRNLFAVNKDGNIFLGNSTDNQNVIVVMGKEANTTQGYAGGPTHSIITWLDTGNNLSDPSTTADMIGCAGARFYPYKDGNSGQFDMAYGQSATAAWVLISDESIQYQFWTGGQSGAVTPFLRCFWDGNGDFTNMGKILVRKSTGAGTKGIPGIELEQTSAGTNAIKVRAPATVGAARTQLLQDLNATVVMVGDKAPTVGSRQMGKVDLTAQSASIASTGLTSGAAAGVYRISYTLLGTATDAGAPTVQATFSYTDTLGATTQTTATLTLSSTGRDRGTLVVQLASGDITYTATVTGTIGTARFALYIRVESLG